MKNWIKYLDLIILLLASLVFIIYLFNTQYKNPQKETEECVDVNLAPSFYYESCYDAYSKTIFLGIKRGQDSYNVKDISVYFFDFYEKDYYIEKVPDLGEEEIYKIPAEKNPRSIDIYLGVSSIELGEKVCETPRKVFVGYCPEVTLPESAEITSNPLKSFVKREFVEVKDYNEKKIDLFALSIVEKERIWELQCSSEWECSEWGSCENGIQKRKCYDKNMCLIPTSIPKSSRYCTGECVENWQCEWSECTNGFTTPTCFDLNNCGTDYDIPQKLGCSKSGCVPNVKCSEWSPCEIDYNFLDLVSLKFEDLQGVKRRICRDKNYCARSVEEVKQCLTGVDVYTKSFEKCGSSFIGVYNLLDDSLIARIEIGTENNPYLNIVLEEREENLYCDYCFDGVLNGDEEKVDCGGGCMPCKEKYI